MKESHQPIFDALKNAGFTQRLETAAGEPLDFKFTPYSLNTKLSFRFDNFDDFISFLEHSGNDVSPEKSTLINGAFIELGLKPHEFFWVNFFEKGKEEEM
ncbi:MAG TPA: hypothetical protein VGB50_13010 [Flavobacterium sp.]|jgi:hypothetical protein